jgi:hypothetical protein
MNDIKINFNIMYCEDALSGDQPRRSLGLKSAMALVSLSVVYVSWAGFNVRFLMWQQWNFGFNKNRNLLFERLNICRILIKILY